MKQVLYPLLALGLVLMSANAHASTADANEYEELSYEDLVEQISRKKQKVIRQTETNPLDDIQLHAGIGLITALNTMSVGDRSFARTMQGFEISMGIDLFSRFWTSEAVLRNFGSSGSGSETRSLREFDLRVVHRNPMGDKLGYRAGAGLGTRYFKYADSARRISLNEEVPCILGFMGLESYSSKNLSIGAEMGLRQPLTDSTADKTSLDMMVRLDTTF